MLYRRCMIILLEMQQKVRKCRKVPEIDKLHSCSLKLVWFVLIEYRGEDVGVGVWPDKKSGQYISRNLVFSDDFRSDLARYWWLCRISTKAFWVDLVPLLLFLSLLKEIYLLTLTFIVNNSYHKSISGKILLPTQIHVFPWKLYLEYFRSIQNIFRPPAFLGNIPDNAYIIYCAVAQVWFSKLALIFE